MRKIDKKLEIVADERSFGASTIRLSFALKTVQRLIASDQRSLTPLVEQLLLPSKSGHEQFELEKLRMQFLEFCQSQGVRPVHVADHSRSYQGYCDQDQEFEISLSQFKSFAERHVSVDCCNPVEFNRKLTESLEDAPIVSVGVPRVTVSSVAEYVGDIDSDEERWGFADVATRPNRRRQEKLRELKKNIPGKQPRTNMGRLAIRLAWRHEVETGTRATSADLMRLLREHARENDKPKWLGDPSIDVAGEDAVTFFVGEVMKTYRLQSCKRVLREWRSSYHK